MARETKAARAERDESIERLRGWIRPGETVYTILDHVSASGMSRAIRAVVPTIRHEAFIEGRWEDRTLEQIASIHGPKRDRPEVREVVDHIHPNYAIGRALGLKHWKRNGRDEDALVVGGCGMDMGFHLVYELSSVLYGGRGCDCGGWRCSACKASIADSQRRDPCPHCQAPAEQIDWVRPASCPHCKGGGYLLTSGYACLGKGRCPSNYHNNHRDRIRCEGVTVGEEQRRCWAPGGGLFSKRDEIPEDWPRRQIDISDGCPRCGSGRGIYDETCPDCDRRESIEGPPLSVLHTDHDGAPYEVCPTCDGAGSIDNPEGKERFDLRHFDGYALRHRWL